MTLIPRFRNFLALVLILVTGSLALGADSPVIDRIVKSGVLKVGMSGNQAPMNTRSRTGQLIGFEVDLANMLTAVMDVKLQIVVKPFPDLLPALEAGEVDIVMSGMTITAERSAKVSFVGPYMVSGKSILTKSKTLAAAQAAKDINQANLTIVVLENSTSQSYVEKYIPEVKLVTSKDYSSAVKMVLDNKADALVADMPVCMLSVLQYPDQDLVTLDKPFTIEPLGMALSANDPQFLNLIENYISTLEGMGLMDQLRIKWLEDSSWIAALP